MDRAEKLKAQIETEKRLGKYHEQLHIEEDSTGHSYESVMGRFLDGAVTVVEVEDPYIRAVHQVRERGRRANPEARDMSCLDLAELNMCPVS